MKNTLKALAISTLALVISTEAANAAGFRYVNDLRASQNRNWHNDTKPGSDVIRIDSSASRINADLFYFRNGDIVAFFRTNSKGYSQGYFYEQ